MAQDSSRELLSSRARPPQRSAGSFIRRVPLSNLQIVLIALAVVGGRLIIDFSQRILEGQRKIAEQRYLEADIASLTREQQRLEADKAYYSSPAYVEAWAHDQGKMVREGEILVIPIYDKHAQIGVAITSKEPTRPMPTWYVWWSLFLDSPPPLNSNTLFLSEGTP